MKIVIEIDDKYRDKVQKELYKDIWNMQIMKYVNELTVLPKGHGRLGDLDALYTDMDNGIKAGMYIDGYENYGHINDMDDCLECVKYADTIIEAS